MLTQMLRKLSILVPISRILDRPERGWDPVTPEYAQGYARKSGVALQSTELDEVEHWVGGFSDKRILDVGGGPGVFSIPMAKSGANVVWHDASLNYMSIAKQQADEHGVLIDWNLGRLEDIAQYRDESFDFIFCRVSWYYNVNDSAFADLLLKLIKHGGCGYISTHTREHAGGYTALYTALQRLSDLSETHLKTKLIINHKPKGSLTSLIASLQVKEMRVDMAAKGLERVFFRKI